MARASRGESWEKAKSPFATTLWRLMNRQPVTTQAQLAEITGKTRQTISQYVNGISEPSYDTLVRIADHFHVSLDYLLGRSDISTIDLSVQEIHRRTGLTEENIVFMQYLGEDNTNVNPREILEPFINDVIDFALSPASTSNYLLMNTALESSNFQTPEENLQLEDYLNGWRTDSENLRKKGYIVLNSKEAALYHFSQIIDLFRNYISNKYFSGRFDNQNGND